MSVIVPPPLAMPTLPKKPEIVRITMRVSMFGARAVGTCRRVKMKKHHMYMALRPKVSLNGARTSGPTPSMITNPVVVAMTICSSVSKSLAICLMPGVNMEDASGETMAMRAMMATLVNLALLDQALGFSGSSSSNLMVCGSRCRCDSELARVDVRSSSGRSSSFSYSSSRRCRWLGGIEEITNRNKTGRGGTEYFVVVQRTNTGLRDRV